MKRFSQEKNKLQSSHLKVTTRAAGNNHAVVDTKPGIISTFPSPRWKKKRE